MAKKFPTHPKHPERVCWGCDRYCAADALSCGNGTLRTPHPLETFGEDWLDWGLDHATEMANETTPDTTLCQLVIGEACLGPGGED
ncbi:MAG: DUF3079 domain-containing protein [Gammaproteobacteria bacterium]|nr:DUF3079 domain-containing protein [Gammaproteobacteria bacterium]